MQWVTPFQGCEIPVIADESDNPTTFILAHGAGSHMEQKTVLWLSQILRDAGLNVVRFNFMYRVQGKSLPDRMPVLEATYQAVIQSVRQTLQPKRLLIGGHSMGGRTASMLESKTPVADGLLLFGYPLHPVGKTETLRDAHLPNIHVPTLQINGTEDPLCTKEIMEDVVDRLDPKIWTLHWVEGADHSYAVKKSSGRTSKDVAAEIQTAVSHAMTSPT